jgi:hypothetical protein
LRHKPQAPEKHGEACVILIVDGLVWEDGFKSNLSKKNIRECIKDGDAFKTSVKEKVTEISGSEANSKEDAEDTEDTV